jgi:molybdopterin/thiamine biosynthesis adenylyltransferase
MMMDAQARKLTAAIQERAADTACPDGSTRRTIDLGPAADIAERHSVSVREVEIAALRAGVIPRRYLRNFGSLGAEGQIALLSAAVAIIGMGGLGGVITRNLARVGVGRLVLVDGDVFSEDNLNRQEFCTEDNIGVPKVEAAAREIARINRAVQVTAVNKLVGRDELIELLRGCTVAVDALDNIPSRFALSDAASAVGVPLVHGSVAGFVGQVATMRPDAGGFTAIFGDRRDLPERGVEVSLGNLPGVVGTVASLQTVEVIKLLTNKGEPISGRLLFMDLESCVFDFFDVKVE